MGVGGAIASLFRDDYKKGVEDTTDKTIVFVNPDAFDAARIWDGFYNSFESEQDLQSYVGKLTPEDIRSRVGITEEDLSTMRDIINDQTDHLGEDLTDDQLKMMILRSMDSGPNAYTAKLGEEMVGIVTIPNDKYDDKNEIVEMLSGRTIEQLGGSVPGAEYLWERAMGIHEGAHLNQTEHDETTGLLGSEADADRVTVNWLRSEGHEEMAQAWIDFRVLSEDAGHATSIFLNDDKPIDVIQQHYDAAIGFRAVMAEAVAERLGVETVDVMDALRTDPTQYNDARLVIEEVQKMLDEGVQSLNPKDNPHVHAYIEAYVGAFQRQILDRVEPVPEVRHSFGAAPLETEGQTGAILQKQPDSAALAGVSLDAIDGGVPVVTLKDGDTATMTIGGVGATDFFASHADEDMGAQRVALAAESQDLSTEFKTAEPIVSAGQQFS